MKLEGVTFFSKETYVFVVYWSNFLNVSSQIMPPDICLCWKHFGAAYHCRPPTFTPRHHSVCDEVQTRGRLFEMILTSRSTRIPIPKTHMFIHMFLGGRSTEKSLQFEMIITIFEKRNPHNGNINIYIYPQTGTFADPETHPLRAFVPFLPGRVLAFGLFFLHFLSHRVLLYILDTDTYPNLM